MHIIREQETIGPHTYVLIQITDYCVRKTMNKQTNKYIPMSMHICWLETVHIHLDCWLHDPPPHFLSLKSTCQLQWLIWSLPYNHAVNRGFTASEAFYFTKTNGERRLNETECERWAEIYSECFGFFPWIAFISF
jgi:hypothetical protein